MTSLNLRMNHPNEFANRLTQAELRVSGLLITVGVLGVDLTVVYSRRVSQLIKQQLTGCCWSVVGWLPRESDVLNISMLRG